MSVAAAAQEWETSWWGSCLTTFGEENKQITYAHRMGLVNEPRGGHWPVYDLGGAEVLDVGGGPVSILLKCVNVGLGTIVDPLPIPQWCRDRYEYAGIRYLRRSAETFEPNQRYDEAWIYNCLQHTEDPEAIVRMARGCADVLRVFEWIETETNVGHPQTLHADELNDWVGATGEVGYVNENGAVGLAWWGYFR